MHSYRLIFVAGLSFIALCLISVPLLAQQPTFGGGDGSQQNPYIVSTPLHLQDINYTDAFGDFIFYDDHFLQTDDIDMDGIVWQPIGNGIYPFTGSYDGNDYIISNLLIDNPINAYAGLFGYINGATITNVGLQNVNVSGQYFVGSLVGYSDIGLIENCRSSGGSVNATGQYIGGLVGYNYQGSISKSQTGANLSVLGDNYVGGLVGYNNGGLLLLCYSRSNVAGGDWVAGLIAKQVNGTIDQCYATGSVDGLRFTGGLVGYDGPTRNTVTDSYWDVDTTEQLYSDGGEGRTTGDMTYPYDTTYPYNGLPYINWDFDQAPNWSHDENINYNGGYPLIGPFAGGNGEENTPFRIATPSHLNNVRRFLSSHFVQVRNIDIDNMPFNAGQGWEPIGEPADPFTGCYDGSVYTIDNLFIDRPNSSHQGLFGYIETIEANEDDGNMRNISLTNVSVVGDSMVGSLAGEVGYFDEATYIKNCTSVGTVIGNKYVGGLTGSVSVTALQWCVTEGSVSTNGLAETKYIGGLSGMLDSSLSHNSYSEADVNHFAISGGCCIGGLIGRSRYSAIVKSYASGEVNAGNSSNVGGLVGKAGAEEPPNPLSLSSIVESTRGSWKDRGPWAGGGGGGGGPGGGWFESSFATGDVTGYSHVGGLVGKTVGIEGYWHVVAISYASKGEVFCRNEYGGGLIGSLSGRSGVVANYSTGKVLGVNNPDYLGGLIGYICSEGWNRTRNRIRANYWDIESSGLYKSAHCDSVDTSIGKTTVKMMQHETFTGDSEWSFQGDFRKWNIAEWFTEPNSSYPYLVWQDGECPWEHNEPINKEQKPISGSGLHWVSFPWMSRDLILEDPPDSSRSQTAEEALRPVNNDDIGYIDLVTYWYASLQVPAYEEMEWDDNEWSPDNIGEFSSTQGFIIDVNHQNPFDIPFYGTRETPETEFTLWPGEWDNGVFDYNDNWIGYFLTTSQDYDEAFSEEVLEDIESIQKQNGGVYRFNGGWFGTTVTLEYGGMYKVALRDIVDQPITGVQWNIPQGRSSERQSSPKPKPQHFEISYGTEYESIFIADIADDEDVVEIGVYAGGDCIGAVVFEESYPLEILAYTNDSHLNETISFILYLDDDSYERYEIIPVKDLDTHQYSRQSFNPLVNKFSIVKIDRAGGQRGLAVEEETEEVLQPALRLSQNYPNPFSLRAGVRGQGLTSISLSLPQGMPVSLNVYNIKGQLVRTLISGEANRGEHTVSWNGKDENNRDVGSGIYFYRLETADEIITRKMLIVR